jgi:hypothetical protein
VKHLAHVPAAHRDGGPEPKRTHVATATLVCAFLVQACAAHPRPQSVASIPAVASGGAVDPATPAAPATPARAEAAPASEEITAFANDTRAVIEQASGDVRRAIEAGRLTAAAADELTRERDYAERLLAQYSADGVLTRDERVHVTTAATQIAQIAHRAEFRVALGGGARTHAR